MHRRGNILLVPHMGMGDMMLLRGMVSVLCDTYDKVAVVGYRRYRDSLQCLFEDLTLTLVLIDAIPDIKRAVALFPGYDVVALGDHDLRGPAWRDADELWPRALYLSANVDPCHMRGRFALPRSRQRASAKMLAKVLSLVGDAPYVLVHDDALRSLRLPPGSVTDGVVVLHVDDPRFASNVIFDYVDTLRHAAALHAIDSCFALLVDLAALGTPLTVHAYAKNSAMADIYACRPTLIRRPPQTAAGTYLDPRFLRHIDRNRVQEIVEVGSREGLDAIRLAAYYGCRVHAFECNPLMTATFKATIAAAGHDVIANTNALGNEDTVRPFYSCPINTNPGASSFFRRIDDAQTAVEEVRMARLDSYLEQRGVRRVDLLCMDVQGFEMNVMLGAGAYLEHCSYVIMEVPKVQPTEGTTRWLPKGCHSKYVGAPTFPEIAAFMEDKGFQLAQVCTENDIEDNVLWINAALLRYEAVDNLDALD